MCLALDLAWRGVAVTLVDERHPGEPPSVKCNHVAARTMEAFRRLGFVGEVRDAGLPADHAHDVAFRTTTTGIEFARIRIPCRRDRYRDRTGADAGWPTPEPPHRINQIYLEPILGRNARAHPRIQIRHRTRAEEVDQDATSVTASVRDLDTGEVSELRARYLVGCDGGSSLVRHALGAELHGDAVIMRTQSTDVRVPDLVHRMGAPPAWGTFSMNPRRSGMVYAIDGRERFLVHNYLRDDEADFNSIDREASLRTILGVGNDVAVEVLAQEDWYGRRLVADRFADGRIFICGDAAHLWVPYAGYGMNAGIADALDLSWMLAGTVAGWGGPRLLDAYPAERQPITEQVSRHAMDHALAVAGQRRAVPAEIEDDTPAGAAARAATGERGYGLNVAQYAAAGLNFGYFYGDSPVIAGDEETPPAYSMGAFTPSTVPGCRLPHVWLDGERSLYDALGPGFTLVCPPDADLDAAAGVSDAARRRGVPCEVVRLSQRVEPYDDRLVLARPDQHIAWRGTAEPDDPGALIALVTGAAAVAVVS